MFESLSRLYPPLSKLPAPVPSPPKKHTSRAFQHTHRPSPRAPRHTAPVLFVAILEADSAAFPAGGGAAPEHHPAAGTDQGEQREKERGREGGC